MKENIIYVFLLLLFRVSDLHYTALNIGCIHKIELIVN